jgi:hypothetical protein
MIFPLSSLQYSAPLTNLWKKFKPQKVAITLVYMEAFETLKL